MSNIQNQELFQNYEEVIPVINNILEKEGI